MESVTLIAGMLNDCEKVFYWQNELICNYCIGDYAIVKNVNGYDLIKIIGLLTTTRDKVHKFANNKYETVKKVVKFLKREEVEVL